MGFRLEHLVQVFPARGGRFRPTAVRFSERRARGASCTARAGTPVRSASPRGRRIKRVVIGVDANGGLLHVGPGLQIRNVQPHFGVKVDGRGNVVGAESTFDGGFENGQNGLLLFKLHLNLGGVNVDVDARRIDGEVQRVERVLPFGDEPFVGPNHRAVKQPVLDKSAVHKQELFAPRFSCGVRLAHKPFDRHHVGLFLHRHEAFVVFGTQNAHNPLTHRPGLELEEVGALVGQGECNAGMGKRHALKLVHHMAHLDRIGFQEVAPRRNVVEEVLHVKGRPHGTGLGFLSHDLRPMASDQGAHVGTCLTSRAIHMGDGRDRRKGLAAEALRGQRKQVVRGLKLRRRMTFKTHAGVLRAHPRAVVQHLDGRSAGVKHVHFHRRRASVHSVLDQLLDHRCRALNDLACGNLVGNVVGKNVDCLAHPLDCMK